MDREDESIGLFPGWRSLYVTVLLFNLVLILLLYLFSRVFDFSS